MFLQKTGKLTKLVFVNFIIFIYDTSVHFMNIWSRFFFEILPPLVICGSCHLDGSSNFEIGVEFWNVYLLFVSCWIEKKDELLGNIFIEITQPFLYLEGVWFCQKYIFHCNIKKTKQHKSFDIGHKFQHSTPCPNDMIHA